MRQRRWVILLCLVSLYGLAGCGGSPYVKPKRAPDTIANSATTHPLVVRSALAQVNKPYRYGGQTPQGFDCSGLIYYVYQRSGITIPRTTLGQLRSAQPVSLRDIAPGDLLFFRQRSRKPSHVGLYVGNGRFVHASTSEQAVIISRLQTSYWKDHIIGAGRYTQ